MFPPLIVQHVLKRLVVAFTEKCQVFATERIKRTLRYPYFPGTHEGAALYADSGLVGGIEEEHYVGYACKQPVIRYVAVVDNARQGVLCSSGLNLTSKSIENPDGNVILSPSFSNRDVLFSFGTL